MHTEVMRSKITTVIAIVVLGGAIIVGTYLWHNHVVTDHVRQALESTAAAKVVVMEAATVHGGLTHIKTSELAYNTSASTSPYVARITIGDGGRISILTKDTGTTPDVKLVLVPSDKNGAVDGAITWTCFVTAGSVDLVPDGCLRGTPADMPSGSLSAPSTGGSATKAHSS